MKKILSFIGSDSHIDKVGGSWKKLSNILEENNLDGIEVMTGGYYDIEKIKDITPIGHHLLYFPSWLHMWLEDKEELVEEFGSLEYGKKVYGGWGKEQLIKFYKNEIQESISMKSEYVVFHVAHVGLDEVFSDKFKYGKKEVLRYTTELINEIFDKLEDGPKLLFENLWWPGMDLLDENAVEEFIKSINYPHTGIMFDISHFTLTNKNIKNYEELYFYIEKKILNSEIMKKYIMGIHLNSTFPYEYLKSKKIKLEEKSKVAKSRSEKYKFIIDHITSLDRHEIYDDFSINKIIEKLNIKYLVYEFKWESLDDLLKNIRNQNKMIK